MSFLAPLYALAALAISLPIIFHFLQRSPRGKTVFSSLMFLRATPPKITKRSRLSDLLLLFLRALALLLIALAFCRPFLRSLEQLSTDDSQSQVVFLIDTSASMRREGVWAQVESTMEKILNQLNETDQVALYSYNERLHSHVALGGGVDAEGNQQLARDAFATISPGWLGSDLGHAMVSVADELQSIESLAALAERRIVLITDLQEGSDLAALQDYNWPDEIVVDLHRIETSSENASLHAISPVFESENPPADGEVRIRVSNDKRSTLDQFELRWIDADEPSDTPRKIQVVPGRSRVVTLKRPEGAEIVELDGDAHRFDNRVYLPINQPRPRTLRYYQSNSENEPGDLLYFLRRAPLGTQQRPISVESNSVDNPTQIDGENTALVVWNGPPSPAWIQPLTRYIQEEGRLLVVMDPTQLTDEQVLAPGLASLLGVDHLEFQRVKPRDYAMLSSIDFQHPLFAVFNDAKYNDFTKVRFWSHYRPVTEHEQAWTVLARFDDSVPALVERELGDGVCWILNTGWHKTTSQLALSSKFVPLLVMMLENRMSDSFDHFVFAGSPVPFLGESYSSVILPDGEVQSLTSEATRFEATSQPGIYSFSNDKLARRVAVQLDLNESRVAPMDVARLEQWDVKLGRERPEALTLEQKRQLKNFELEGQQKLWRWLILAALAVLAVETYVAGRSSSARFIPKES